MNLEQLRGFVEIARTGNFTRAADAVHLTQPSLSRQIASLETELGAELFDRGRGSTTLTAAGDLLLPRARRILADAESIRSEMAELAGLQRGRVRLGATPTLCVSLVAEAIDSFHDQHPDIELQLVEGGSRILIDQLTLGGLDIALITASDVPTAEGSRLVRTPILTEELVVVSAASRDPIRAGATIDLAALARLPLISFAQSYDLRATTDAAFEAAGIIAAPVLEGAEMETVLRFVERGLGVAIVPAMVVHDRPALRSTRFEGGHLTRTVSLAHRSEVAQSPAARAMEHALLRTATIFADRDPATESLLAAP